MYTKSYKVANVIYLKSNKGYTNGPLQINDRNHCITATEPSIKARLSD